MLDDRAGVAVMSACRSSARTRTRRRRSRRRAPRPLPAGSSPGRGQAGLAPVKTYWSWPLAPPRGHCSGVRPCAVCQAPSPAEVSALLSGPGPGPPTLTAAAEPRPAPRPHPRPAPAPESNRRRPNAARSASANSRQLPYRSAGDFASARAKTASALAGNPGRQLDSAGGGSDSCAYMTAVASSRGNGGAPVSISNAAQASAYWSARPSTSLPSICSGEM